MQKNNLDHIALIIPSFKPPARLPEMVSELYSLGFKNILIVDDGSPAEYGHLFSNLKNITLISNPQNLGKGAALKRAYKHVLEEMGTITSVLSCDDDYQHRPLDILKVAIQTLPQNKAIILGARSFDGNIPLKSLIGNIIMRELVSVVSGKQVGDTQTGLRSIPRDYLHEAISIPAEKFNFELITLLHFLRKNYVIREVSINTIYFQNNTSTRFRGTSDSINVIFSLINYYLKK